MYIIFTYSNPISRICVYHIEFMILFQSNESLRFFFFLRYLKQDYCSL